ncbi:MAG: hypothetical protein IKQ91_00415 [Oscillospiraceae bacterium]|nr:hypothetical protein [Oscillospiraceae bacterium]
MANEETRKAAEREAEAELDQILKEIDAEPAKPRKVQDPAKPRRTQDPAKRPANGQRRRPASADGTRRPAKRTEEDATQRPRRTAPRQMEVESVDGTPRRSTNPQRTADPAKRKRPDGSRSASADAPRKRRPAASAERTAQRSAAAAVSAEKSAAHSVKKHPAGSGKKKSGTAAKKRSPHIFRIAMLIYVIVFLLITMFLMHRLHMFLGEYEASRPQYTIDAYISKLDKGFYNNMVRQKVDEMQVSEYENAEVIAETLNLEEMDGQSFTWAKKMDEYTDENPVYYIRCGEKAIASVALEREGSTEHFDLPVWKVAEPVSLIELATEPAYEVEVTVPEGTSVSINGIAVPQAAMEPCDSSLILDDAAKTYAKQPTAVKATVTGLYVAPKVQAYDTQGNILTPVGEPDTSAAKQVYAFEPKDEVAPDPQFVTHMENLMGAYINYMANKDEDVWGNLGILDQYLVPNGNAYSMLHSIVMDVNWNNPYTARVDRELTISHVKMYADNVCTVEAHYNYQLTKNVVNDYIGTIRWTMIKVGNTWMATNFEQIADGESVTDVPENLPIPDDEAAAQAERDAAAAAAAEEAAPAEQAAPADAAAPAAPAEPVI